MNRPLLLAATSLLLLACPVPGRNDGGTGGGAGGGGGGSGGATGFDLVTLDPTATERRWLAMAYHQPSNRIGVAYYVKLGTQTNSQLDYAVKYVSWKDGVVSAPETIKDKVQFNVGIGIAFQPNGEPAVVYIGGGWDSQSLTYLQDDLMMSVRSGGTWTESTVARTGDQVTCGNPVSDRGEIAGVWPAIAIDSTGKKYVAWRDIHSGQYNEQDWRGSDLELAEGTGTPAPGVCLAAGGNGKQAWGGRNNFVLVNDQPLLVFDRCDIAGPESDGFDVYWVRRTDAGTWTGPRLAMPNGNTQTGATVAYDPQEGYGIAAVERPGNILRYISSTDGESWTFPDTPEGSGTGFWFPSLAMDPVNHEPAVAFYFCSATAGVDETSCPANQDELRVTQRVAGNWRTVAVDREGGWLPRLGFFPNGKRFVVYRAWADGVLKLATEK